MANSPKLVAIAYDLNFRHAAEIFNSVHDYIRQQELNWQLLPLNFGFEPKLMELAHSGRLSGAIGTFVSDEWVRGLLSRGVSAVNLYNFSRISSVPSISLNDSEVGLSACRHLLEQGARSFAFIGKDQAYYNQIRRNTFAENCPPGTFVSIDPSTSLHALAVRLSHLARPVGVLCSNDRIARELCCEARLLGMEVGLELLVIGIGNEATESTFAGIELSSFDIPAAKIGRMAAGKLAVLIEDGSDEPPYQESISIHAVLIPRASTLASPQARLAERAVSEIARSVSDANFDVNSLSRGLGVSRRALELAMRKQLKQSPYQLLSKERMKRAKSLLLDTNQTIMKIGEACGYPQPHHFCAWFKKRTGLSPRAFRAAAPEPRTTG